MKLRFVPFEELDGRPHVIVDGSSTEGTVVTLSHWPKSPAPPGLARDLSAEMALAAASSPEVFGAAELVSNNHFDQDGLMSVFALTSPESFPAALIADVAAAGDFGTYRSRDAARVSMAIAALALSAPQDTTALYTDMLGRLPSLLHDPSRFRDAWAEEDATLDRSEQLIRSGAATVEELPALDLAIVTVPEGAPTAGGHRFVGHWAAGLHPMAINNATDRFAILAVRGRQYSLTYRYETWVQYQSRRPRPRVDLAPLAGQLSAAETSAQWIADSPGELVPELRIAGGDESSLDALVVRRHVERYLASAAPAWDPYLDPVLL